jgi:hypothetical protein
MVRAARPGGPSLGHTVQRVNAPHTDEVLAPDSILLSFKRSRTLFRVQPRRVLLQELPGAVHMGFRRA